MSAPPFQWAPPRRVWAVDADAAPPFYEWTDVFPYLAPVLAAWRTVADEVATVTAATAASAVGAADAGPVAGPWQPWPEYSLWRPEDGHDWRVVPFAHTFPADDESRRVWVESSAAAFPATVALLRRIPGLRTALLSRLGPKTALASHQGWAQLSNHVLRCHIGVDVPGGAAGRLSGVVVDDEIRHHAEGEMLVFDDSKVHSAFNHHPTRSRTVLIIDIARPPQVPPGCATGGTTEELEAFLTHFH